MKIVLGSFSSEIWDVQDVVYKEYNYIFVGKKTTIDRPLAQKVKKYKRKGAKK